MAAACVWCDCGVGLVEVEGGCLCYSCITRVLQGCIPDRIAGGVCWWWCPCGLEVRRGPYTVDVSGLALLWWPKDGGRALERERDRIAEYRCKVEGVASFGVMLCYNCAALAAGHPLLGPAASVAAHVVGR